MELQPGDIIAVKGGGLFSKIVSFFTRSNYTHVSMMISDTKMIEANWYKKVNIVDFTYDKDHIEIYRYKNSLNIHQQIQVVQSSYDMLDKYYDYFQVLWYMLEFFIGKSYHSPLNLENFIICSELIDNSYLKIGINLVDFRSDGNVTPKDIVSSKELIRIY